jgi:hypothetical protein
VKVAIAISLAALMILYSPIRLTMQQLKYVTISMGWLAGRRHP